MNDQGQGLTIISRCGQSPFQLVSDRVRSFEWESYAGGPAGLGSGWGHSSHANL